MFSLIIFLFILGILIFIHEFGHFIVAKKLGVRVEKFSLGFGRTLVSKKCADTEYTLNAIPLGGYVKMAGDNLEEYAGKPDEYFSKPVNKRAAIIAAGSLLNYTVGILFFWFIFIIGYPAFTTKVGGLIDGLGAQEAGLRVNDKIIAIDGEEVRLWEDLQKTVQGKKDTDRLKISFLREGKEFILEVPVKTKEFFDLVGRKQSVGLLGITPADEFIKVRHGIGESFPLSISKAWELTKLTYAGLWRMLTGKLSMRESMTGPLGIFYITSKAANLGAIAVLHLLAVLSVSLAIFNLLPLPVLDGGHLVLLLVEKIRKKALSLKAERIITQSGLVLIVSLALFVTYNDIMRIFGNKITGFFNK